MMPISQTGNVDPSLLERPTGVLVVDDEQAIRDVLGLFLRRQGVRVWLAGTGADAIEVYRHNADDIALVLLDVRMPGLDGPQTLAKLRGINPYVMCHFMSGNWDPYTESDLTAMGASLLVKPVRLDTLARLVQQCVTGR